MKYLSDIEIIQVNGGITDGDKLVAGFTVLVTAVAAGYCIAKSNCSKYGCCLSAFFIVSGSFLGFMLGVSSACLIADLFPEGSVPVCPEIFGLLSE